MWISVWMSVSGGKMDTNNCLILKATSAHLTKRKRNVISDMWGLSNNMRLEDHGAVLYLDLMYFLDLLVWSRKMG